jgi:catechol 2,3-dioxygenase-like lactoylglutathione lyase family enzyme
MSADSKPSHTTLHTVIVQTSKMEELATFYGEGLELGEPVSTGENHLGFPLPNAYFGFDLVPDSPIPTGVISLWFEVDDLDLVFHRFKDMGAEIKYSPTPKPWGATLAALYDPDGNLFGLAQRQGTGG